MFAAALIIFRETLEIAMILGIVLASTRGLFGRARWVIVGLAGGLAGAALLACFTQTIADSLAGTGLELFNAAILFAAALTIGWTVLWMRQHGREMGAQLKKIGKHVSEGATPLYSLALIIGLAMLREGSEMVLFTYGMVISGQDVARVLGGTLIGLLLGAVAGGMLYVGLLKVPARYTLHVTSWLLMLLVAGLTATGVGFLSAAGYFSRYSQPVWDSSWLLDDASLLGQTMHGLIGYNAQPSFAQLTAYLSTLLMIGIFANRPLSAARAI